MTFSAAARAMILPVSVEPVNAILSTPGCEVSAAPAVSPRPVELTDGYEVPADGCTTYSVCLRELDAFEKDLHAHVHLENNILFPKASALEHVK